LVFRAFLKNQSVPGALQGLSAAIPSISRQTRKVKSLFGGLSISAKQQTLRLAELLVIASDTGTRLTLTL
jgi:hypothetical protein